MGAAFITAVPLQSQVAQSLGTMPWQMILLLHLYPVASVVEVFTTATQAQLLLQTASSLGTLQKQGVEVKLLLKEAAY